MPEIAAIVAFGSRRGDRLTRSAPVAICSRIREHDFITNRPPHRCLRQPQGRRPLRRVRDRDKRGLLRADHALGAEVHEPIAPLERIARRVDRHVAADDPRAALHIQRAAGQHDQVRDSHFDRRNRQRAADLDVVVGSGVQYGRRARRRRPSCRGRSRNRGTNSLPIAMRSCCTSMCIACWADTSTSRTGNSATRIFFMGDWCLEQSWETLFDGHALRPIDVRRRTSHADAIGDVAIKDIPGRTRDLEVETRVRVMQFACRHAHHDRLARGVAVDRTLCKSDAPVDVGRPPTTIRRSCSPPTSRS